MKIQFLYIIFISFVISSCNPNIGCGFDDGPFQATKVSIPIDSIIENEYVVFDNCTLYFNNRDTNMCPIISFVEEDSLYFSLEMDLLKTPDYSAGQLFEISHIEIKTNTKKTLKITFWCYWTFGHEWGCMKINKKTAANNFCLSW